MKSAYNFKGTQGENGILQMGLACSFDKVFSVINKIDNILNYWKILHSCHVLITYTFFIRCIYHERICAILNSKRLAILETTTLFILKVVGQLFSNRIFFTCIYIKYYTRTYKLNAWHVLEIVLIFRNKYVTTWGTLLYELRRWCFLEQAQNCITI